MESKNHSGQERPLRSSNPNHPPPPVSVSLRATSLQFVNTSGGDDTTADQLKNVQLPAAWWACARKGSGASISLPTIPKSPGVAAPMLQQGLVQQCGLGAGMSECPCSSTSLGIDGKKREQKSVSTTWWLKVKSPTRTKEICCREES